jgi:hypothetical protein
MDLVVRNGAGLDHRQLYLDRRVPGQFVGLVAQAAPATEPVDRPVPSGRRDPGTRVGRDTAIGPDLEGGDERVLDGLLGEIEVAQDADQRGDRPSLLLAEQAVDDVVGGGGVEVQPALAPTGAWSCSEPEVSQIGRTSMDPARMPGHCAASASASSRSLASMR